MKIETLKIEIIKEDGDAGGDAGTAGMGDVVGTSPSTNIGVTTEPGYSSGGGTIGSGDLGSHWGRPYGYSQNKSKKNKKRKKSLFGLKQDYTTKPKSVGKLKKFSDFK